MEWQTKIKVEPPSELLSHNTPCCFLGSCFAQEISRRMQAYKFKVSTGGFGILFNPASIVQAIELLCRPRPFLPEEVFADTGSWNSFYHHSDYAAVSREAFLQQADERLRREAVLWREARTVCITLGTARAYVYRGPKEIYRGKVVANCHKCPASDFVQEFVGPQQIARDFGRIIEKSANKKWIFTVSPVRHWKDGAHANQVSKAALFMGIEALQKRFDSVYYFPAYELLMDELRDYRFYAEDRFHPSREALDYIWQTFLQTVFTPETARICAKIEKLRKALEHRIICKHSPQSRAFMVQTLQYALDLAAEFPDSDFSDEIKTLKEFEC